MWAYKRLFGRESVDVLPSRNSTSGSWQDETDNADKDVMITDDKDEDSRLVERKTKLEGVVTKLDRIDSVGVISNCYRFGAEQFLTDLAKGTVVTFNAERNRGCAIWTATDIKIKGGSREWAGDDGRKTRLQRTIWADYRVLDILQDKIIVGLDPDCESGVGRSCHKIRVEIRKELLPKEYPVVLGDWLHLRFKGGEGDDIATAELISVDFTEIIFKTGTINMTRGHLCVDGSIYFTNDLIEDGAKPCVGDTARVTAVASDQVQLSSMAGRNSGQTYVFKKRAVSIVIDGGFKGSSTDFTEHVRSPEQTPAIIRENVFMELIQDKNKIRILPKGTISFKTKILGSTSLEVVTIENNGESRFILRRIFMGRIQDVAKFDFVFQKGFLNPEDLFIELQPHRSWAFTIKCTPIHLGRTKELLLFDFGSFKIGRWLYVFSLAPNQDEILHCKPVILNKIRRKVTKELIDNLIIEKNMLVVSAPSHVRAPFFVPHKIGASKVPTGVLECFRAKNQSLLLELYPSVVQELYSGNYVNQFKVSLWFEEVHNEIMRREYDLKGTVLQRSDWENYYCIKVPGLKEFHPPVWTGDLVRVYESLNSTEMFEGPIKKIILEDADVPSIVVQLPEKFNFTYDGSPRVIQFTLGRVPYKRMHFAVEQAFKYLGPDWLFPTNLILEEPRIDYIEDESDNLHPAIQKQVMQGKSNGSGSSIKVKLINDTGRQRNLKPFQGNITEPTSLDKVKLKWYNHKLNDEQRDAVKRILKGQGRPLPYIIFGPPGTGKTVTVVEAILQVYFMEPTSRILVTVPSNAATDLIAEHLVATNRFKPGDFVRLNGFHRYGIAVANTIVEYCEDGENLNDIAIKRLIICTVATAGQFFQLSLNTGHFSHVFIDEAGYCTEPETMIPCVLAAIDKQSQVILVGDPEQLGPVLMCDIAFNKVLERSFLERLMNTKVYARDETMYPRTKYNSIVMTKLVKSYRAHPLLLKLPSQLFYSDELVSCARQEDTNDLLRLPFLPKKGIPLVFHGVDGNCSHDVDLSPSWFNAAEAYQVIEYVKLLRKNGVAVADIGIITPYRKQIEKIRAALKMTLSEDSLPRIASVQEFQGGERKVMIISTVRSYSQDIIERKVSRLDFLYSKKRFNVAITRAKSLMIVIGNPVVLSYNTYWRQLLEYAIQLGVYIGCQVPKLIDSRWTDITNSLAVNQVLKPINEEEASSDSGDEDGYYCSIEHTESRF